MAKRTAVIDLGSNSVRIVIYERTSRFAFHLVHEAKSRVRISENAYENGAYLQEEPQNRAFQALKEFSFIIEEYKVRKTLCVATSALRDAPNKRLFISKVKKELNIHIKIISGEKEAYLGGIAAANLLHLDTALTIDIGGGSTELALYDKKKVLQTFSLDLGTVRLKELYFDNADIEGAKRHILNEFSKLPPTLKHKDIVGIGGTLRALSKMIMTKEDLYFKKIHGFTCKLAEQKDYFDDILNADEARLKKLGVKSDRLDLIQPGLLILDLLIRHVEAKRMTSSGVGVREGLYLSDLLRSQQDRFPQNYNPSIRSLLDRFQQEKNAKLSGFADELFDLCAKQLKLDKRDKNSFLYAIKLSQIGKELNFYEAHRHAYYILLNALNYGFSHKETVLISTLIRYQRKKRPTSAHMNNFKEYLPDSKTCNSLSFLMRLTLDLFGDFQPKDDLDMRLEEGCLYIKAKESYLLKEKIKDLRKNEFFNIRILSE